MRRAMTALLFACLLSLAGCGGNDEPKKVSPVPGRVPVKPTR